MRFTLKNQCPYCRSYHFVRVPRRTYVRFIDSLKQFECDLCRREFLIFRGKQSVENVPRPFLIPIEKQERIFNR